MIIKHRVLFLCRDNASRSIMAEALLRELAGDRFDAFSAGATPAARVHALAIAQLRPGVSDLAILSPKSWHEFTGDWAPRMDLVIAMDDCVDGFHAPAFPGTPRSIRWNFADPLAQDMTEAGRSRAFEKVFWQIVRRVSVFMTSPLDAVPASDLATTVAPVPCATVTARHKEARSANAHDLCALSADIRSESGETPGSRSPARIGLARVGMA